MVTYCRLSYELIYQFDNIPKINSHAGKFLSESCNLDTLLSQFDIPFLL
jgi:hypothetical protein